MADLTREERADWRQWLSYPGGADDNAPLTRGEALRLLDALDAAEARALDAEAAAEGWRQQTERDRAIVTAAREYAAADAAYHEATTGWTEHGEAREWRLRNDARLALLAAVAASPTTERTPS